MIDRNTISPTQLTAVPEHGSAGAAPANSTRSKEPSASGGARKGRNRSSGPRSVYNRKLLVCMSYVILDHLADIANCHNLGAAITH